jgi:DNA polymerase III epsilon subunit-like protein
MAKRKTKGEPDLIFLLIIIGLPFYGIYKVGESIGWGMFIIGIVLIGGVYLWFKSSKEKEHQDALMQKGQGRYDGLAQKSHYQKNQKNLPPIRKHAKPEIDKFLDVKRKTQFIVFDVETNGLDDKCSVLSCSAIKYEIDLKTFEAIEMDRFDRYYYPIEQFNPRAIAVNGLTKDVITEKRGFSNYPKHFTQDTDFEKYCDGVHRFVAHNISFDMRFIPFLKGKKKLCTMMTNMDIVAVEFLEWKNEWKYPTLSETAFYYGIPFKELDLHNSMSDTEITANIFFRMIEAIKP